MSKRVSGNVFTDAKRVLGWAWKRKPKGKGRIKGFFSRMFQEMHR